MPILTYVGTMGIINYQERILIVLRHPEHEGGYGSIWEFPSGRLEANESLEDCLGREILEETGLLVDIIAPIATWSQPNRPLLGITFACEYKGGNVTLSEEHTEYKWVETSRVLEFVSKPSLVANFDSYRNWCISSKAAFKNGDIALKNKHKTIIF